MYNLCKLSINECNNSVLRHPLNVILRSDDLETISEEIKKRVLDGCPARNLLVFEDVVFCMDCEVKYDK